VKYPPWAENHEKITHGVGKNREGTHHADGQTMKNNPQKVENCEKPPVSGGVTDLDGPKSG